MIDFENALVMKGLLFPRLYFFFLGASVLSTVCDKNFKKFVRVFTRINMFFTETI